MAAWWAGIPRHGQCQCPLLTLAPIPEWRGGGRLREVSWWAGSGEGLWGQRPGWGGVKGKGEPGPGGLSPPLTPSCPLWTHTGLPPGLNSSQLGDKRGSSGDGVGGISDVLVVFLGLSAPPKHKAHIMGDPWGLPRGSPTSHSEVRRNGKGYHGNGNRAQSPER